MAEATALSWGVRTLLLIAICVMAFSIRCGQATRLNCMHNLRRVAASRTSFAYCL